MQTAIRLPELGAGADEIRVSCWLVDLGDSVGAGDRIVEVLIDGITFDLAAEQTGVLTRIEKSLDALVHTGDILGWIETDDTPP